MPRRAMGDSKHGTSGERVALKKLGKVNEWLNHTTSGWEFTTILANLICCQEEMRAHACFKWERCYGPRSVAKMH